jgi:hypothetical protein
MAMSDFSHSSWVSLFLMAVLMCLPCYSLASQEQEQEEQAIEQPPLDILKLNHVYRITVPANVDWTDTGMSVFFGQEIRFRTYGGISLQKGNPMAYCGPDGYSLLTVQQPIRDRNIGALIGKIVKLISVEVDEETEEEKRIEEIVYFYIGSNNTIVIPLEGHFFLGINELLVSDNSGEFMVTFYSPDGD